jgi:TonB family protein
MNYIRGISFSLFVHAFILAMCLAFIHWRSVNIPAIDIDLANSSLLLRPQNAVKFRVLKPEQDWLVAARPRAAAVKDAKKAVPKPEKAADWASAASPARRPEWIKGMITEDDYPPDAKKQGLEGEVRVEILIDASGRVMDARIIKSTDPRFSAVVLERLKKSVFQPALDNKGNPIPVRMSVPVIFELR